MLKDAAKTLTKDQDKLLVVPLYGGFIFFGDIIFKYLGLPPKEQFRAFDSAPYQTRKAVITTNIAETSVTISGIVYGLFLFCYLNDLGNLVIDCGFVKIRMFGMNIFEIEKIFRSKN